MWREEEKLTRFPAFILSIWIWFRAVYIVNCSWPWLCCGSWCSKIQVHWRRESAVIALNPEGDVLVLLHSCESCKSGTFPSLRPLQPWVISHCVGQAGWRPCGDDFVSPAGLSVLLDGWILSSQFSSWKQHAWCCMVRVPSKLVVMCCRQGRWLLNRSSADRCSMCSVWPP